MLHNNPETICFIIDKSREFHAKEGVSFPEDMPNAEYESDALQILATHKDDLTYLEVRHVIEDLEPDQQVELLALLYVGRGDFSVDEWVEAVREAKNTWEPSTLTDYLMSKPMLSDFLTEALEALGYSCES